MMGPLLNSKSEMSVRKGVLLYKQLIRPMMELRVPRVEVRCLLPCPEATCVTIQVSCYWCLLVRKEKIHVDLCVSLFVYHIRYLTASFDS